MTKAMKKQAKEELPQELVMEILLRLPPRSILRFSHVSRRWSNMVNQEYFRDLQSQRPPLNRNPEILFFNVQVPRDKPDDHQNVVLNMSWLGLATHHIIKLNRQQRLSMELMNCPMLDAYGSLYLPSVACNGLLCIVPTGNFHERSIMVCNPLTLEYITLPPCTTTEIFDCSAVLGFAPSTKEYKVVGISINYYFEARYCKPRGEIKVYTLGSGGLWRDVHHHVDFEPLWTKESTLYVDGKIHWVVRWPQLRGKLGLLSFDVETEDSMIHNVPGFGPRPARFPDFQLAALQGCRLSMFINQGSRIEAWVLNDTKNDHGWELRHEIVLPSLSKNISDPWNLRRKPVGRLLGIWELDDGVILILLKDTVLLYDGRRVVSREELPDITAYTSQAFWFLCSGYYSSLASLKKYGITQTGERFSNLNRELLPPPYIQLPPNPNGLPCS